MQPQIKTGRTRDRRPGRPAAWAPSGLPIDGAELNRETALLAGVPYQVYKEGPAASQLVSQEEDQGTEK